MRAPVPRVLTLKSINRGSAMRLIQEGAELWDGYILIGEVSAEWIGQVIREKLDALESLHALSETLQRPTVDRYVRFQPAALPPRVVPHDLQEERRLARRGYGAIRTKKFPGAGQNQSGR